jgi:hypothetical protein
MLNMNLAGANHLTVAALETTTLEALLKKRVPDDARMLVDIKILGVTIPDGRWRLVDEKELPEAVAALAKLVGREAKLPTWQRRLARRIDSPEWLLTLEALFPTQGTYPAYMPPKTRVIAVSLADGVRILKSDNNPEPVIARLREAYSANEAENERKAAESAEHAQHEKSAEAKLEKELIEFHAVAWAEASIDERFGILLALASEKTPGDPAGNIRSALAGSKKPGDFPRVEWWKNTGILERLNAPKTAEEEERAQKAAMIECDRIPVRTRDLLWIRHGSDYVAQLKTWRMLQAQQPARTP